MKGGTRKVEEVKREGG